MNEKVFKQKSNGRNMTFNLITHSFQLLYVKNNLKNNIDNK